MAHLFYTVMLKRSDGKVYADLHKTDGQIYDTLEDAQGALAAHPESGSFHVVDLIALTPEEWDPPEDRCLQRLGEAVREIEGMIWRAFNQGQVCAKDWHSSDPDRWRRSEVNKAALLADVDQLLDRLMNV
jgi:hypothetical protein